MPACTQCGNNTAFVVPVQGTQVYHFENGEFIEVGRDDTEAVGGYECVECGSSEVEIDE